VVIEKVSTGGGPKEIAVISGISDDVWAFETATGKQIWHKHFENSLDLSNARPGSTLCPGGQLATPVIGPGASAGKYTLYTVSWDGHLHELNVADGEDVAPPQKFMPGNGKPWSLNLVNGVIYTATSQGCGGVANSFFAFDIASRRASVFGPGGGGMWGRRGVAVDSEGTLYMGTGDGEFSPENKRLGEAIVAVKENASTKQLELKGFFSPPNSTWLWHRDLDVNVSPLVIDYKGKRLLFGTSKECRVWLVDRDVMNSSIEAGPEHRQMLDRSELICNPAARYDAAGIWGAMAAWIDPSGQLYVAAPFLGPLADAYHPPIEIGKPDLGGVTVLRVEENGGKWHMNPVWSYGDIDQGDEAIYANGILFVNGAGEDTYQSQPDSAYDEAPRKPFVGQNNQTGNRLGNSRRATIYAFDAENGKLLWSSGDQITSFNHGSGITAINGKAYIGTFDGYFYCFGVPR
jgi:outer membrane protein assembly factor BamB